jgi:hypothetical protein
MNAKDIMTTRLLTLTPELPVGVAARMLAERGVSGAPVLDADGRLLGMLTEGDLIHRLAATTEKPRSLVPRPLRLGAGAGGALCPQPWAEGAGRDDGHGGVRHGGHAGRRRRRPARAPEHPPRAGGAGRQAAGHRLARRPAEGQPRRAAGGAAAGSDREIARALSQAMRDQPWVDAYFIFPEVKDGVVTIHGYSRSEEVQRALRVLARRHPRRERGARADRALPAAR